MVESIAEGETEWRVEPTPCPVAPGGGKAGQCASAVLDGIIYLCGDFGLLAFNPAGEGSWETIEGCPTTSAPLLAAHDGEIYVMSGYLARAIYLHGTATTCKCYINILQTNVTYKLCGAGITRTIRRRCVV